MRNLLQPACFFPFLNYNNGAVSRSRFTTLLHERNFYGQT